MSEATTDKINVIPEGRPEAYLVTRQEAVKLLASLEQDTFHCFTSAGPGEPVLGADWDKAGVIDEVNKSLTLAILTGDAAKRNQEHALSCVADSGLMMFDIGEITEDMLNVGVGDAMTSDKQKLLAETDKYIDEMNRRGQSRESKQIDASLSPCPSCKGNEVYLQLSRIKEALVYIEVAKTQWESEEAETQSKIEALETKHPRGGGKEAKELAINSFYLEVAALLQLDQLKAILGTGKTIKEMYKEITGQAESKPESSEAGIDRRYDASKQIPGITPEQIEELKAGTAKDPLPCPNPVCQNPHPKLSIKRWSNNTKDYFVVCDVCKMRGPRVKADWNAIRLWNILRRVGQLETPLTKTSRQLYSEFEALTNDTQRWEWILTNQGGEFALHLDNDAPCVTFVGIEEYLEFDEYIRWSAGAVTLLDAMGIKREML